MKHIEQWVAPRGRPFLCLQHSRFCVGSHGGSDIALLLMVIRLVAHGDLLLLDPAPQLAVGVLAVGAVYRLSVVPENLPYGMEQAVHCQDGGG